MLFTKNLFISLLLLLAASTMVCQNNFKVNIIDSSLYLKDSSNKIVLSNIIIKGNTKTRDYIILRELPFYKNDTITAKNLNINLEQYRRQIYNTHLFSEVNFECTISKDKKAQLIIWLKERWYTYPYPQFKLIDRNFDVWYYNYNANLQRVNYGVKFIDYNFTGRKDELSVNALFGLNQNFSINYKLPYFDKKLSKGFSFGAGYIAKKILPYNVNYDDSLLNYFSDSSYSKIVSKTIFTKVSYNIREGFFKQHSFSIGFAHTTVSDSVLLAKNNPNYFNHAKPLANILDLSYSCQYLNVDNDSYPLFGKSYFVTLTKRGLGFVNDINAFTLAVNYNRYFTFIKNWYLSSQSNLIIRLPFNQAFINQTSLGYGDIYLRGLDLNVINGVATFLQKTTVKKKLLQFKIALPFKIKQDSYLPFSIFAKTYFDMGYVYNQPAYITKLNNKLLYTSGIGIDIISLYDISFRVEYCLFNQLNKNHLFLHSQGGF